MNAQKTILVVEDNQINRIMLCEILSSEYKVLEAENGQEALDVLKQYGEQISLILLDIVMPVMDGYTFLSIIKKDPALSSIPVIVTTQKDGESDEVAALSHGATDFVAKPYRPQIILHRVASIINLRETAAMINLVQYDQLTGLYSKEFFYQRIKNILLQNPNKDYDIVCSDIENFKLINDVFGTPAGDRLLQGVADLYKELVGDAGICGRFNADQFACLLERRQNYTNDIFVEASEQLVPFFPTKNAVMKWGIYSIEDRSVPVEQMCDRALLAARSIKGQYGKYFAAYDDELRGKMLREQAITDGMETALEQGQFEIYLQPKYRIRDDSLAGAEALVRWNHPAWGLQSPAEFIPLFEKNGFITKLDQFVWDRACAVLKDWERKGYSQLSISVNVSRADIYNADLADILLETVKRHNLPLSRLHLEITESAYTENPAQIIETVGRLRQLGFVIEMDDFGSGYSSLNMLNQMPLDILKLDMKFIQSETAKPADQGILHFIMGLARTMNLIVVAEGVETKEQLERLREIGCDYVQGYYFARPMPCEKFEILLAEVSQTDVVDLSGKTNGSEKPVLLVIDEDAQFRGEVQSTFEGLYTVAEAKDEQTAISTIQTHKGNLAAVILSLTLPDEEGFAILERLQRKKDAWGIPLIATGAPDKQMEDRALKMGADDYADKPHSQSSLFKRVRRAMTFTESRERERILEDEAYRDYLTGLLNRRGLNATMKFLCQADMPLAVCLFDLDNLKQANDTFGHIKGDQLIQQFASILRAHTRESDVLVRFGGDEFLVLMKRMEREEIALEKGREICRAFQETGLAKTMRTSCSGGIVLWNNNEEPVDFAIEHADQALYCVKTSQKGECCLWKK